MSDWILRLQDTVLTNRLRDKYGDEVSLTDHEVTLHRIVQEFRVGGHEYVVLKSEQAADPEEYLLFRVTVNQDGEMELETIEDDEEWEAVAELYDEMTFEP